MVERADRVEIREDLVAQRHLGRRVARPGGIEAQLEVAHELRRHLGVRGQHVVLVALGEARADALAVHAIGAQDVDLAPVEAGHDHEPVERVGLGVAAADRRDAVGQPLAHGVEVQRPGARPQHAEVLYPRALVAALQPRRDLLDDAQAEVLEDRHRLAELDLPVALVERDARALRLVQQPDVERLAVALEPFERVHVGHGHRRRDRRLVVAREARRPARGQRLPGDRAVALDQPVAQVVVPGPGERDQLLLELAQRHLGDAAGRVHAHVHAHLVVLAQDGGGVDRVGAEALLQQRAERVEQLGVVARGGDRGDQRGRPAVVRAAAQQPDPIALEREQRHDGAAEVLRRRREQLVLREGVEQRDRGLVVVRALDQVLVAQDLAQLAVEQRGLRRRLGVGLGREEAEHARLADDPAVGRHAPHADVVHSHAPVHRRQAIGLGDDQQVARGRPLAHAGRQLLERLRPGEGRRGLVGEDAEPRAGHDGDRVLGDPVLAVAEEDEVLLQQPLEEGDGLVDLVVGVARRARPGQLDHAAGAVGHRRVVEHRAADVAQHAVDRRRQLVERVALEPAVEVEVHDRLARRRLARVQDGGDATVCATLEPDDGVHHVRDAHARRVERRRDGVDEEGQVLGVRLHHGAVALITVLGADRVEHAHDHRPVAAPRGEIEDARDLAVELLGRRLGRGVGRQAAQVGRGELAQRSEIRWAAGADQLHEAVADRCDGEFTGFQGDDPIMSRCGVRCNLDPR